MSGEIKKSIVDVVASHPKTATAIAAGAANFNVWFTNYEPVFKFATSVLGIILVSVLIIKHIIDIKKSLKAD